jgi:hypothetical protein
MSKRAANYARSVTPLRYVFVAAGEQPRAQWLTSEWAWWYVPEVDAERLAGDYKLVGEGPAQYCARLDHSPRCCERCRQRSLSEGRVERGHA